MTATTPSPRSAAATSGVAVHLTDLRRVDGGVAALDGLTLHIEPV